LLQHFLLAPDRSIPAFRLTQRAAALCNGVQRVSSIGGRTSCRWMTL
jgi:hypothetical protein